MPRSNNKKEAKHSKPEEKTTKIKTQKGKIPKNKKRKQHPKLKLFLKILLIIFLLFCVAGAGIVSAMMFGLFGNDFEITKEELIVGNSNTIVLD